MRCDATDCQHNEGGQCSAPEMYVTETAACGTYAPVEQAQQPMAPEGLMGGPGSQMDRGLY